MDQATLTKRRIEACARQAQMNAKNHGGDNATAIMDLLCAIALLAKMSGGDFERLIAVAKNPARACVDDFFPEGKLQ